MKNYIITFADGGEYSAEVENKTQAAIIATAERILERKGFPLEIHAIHFNEEYSKNQIQVPWIAAATTCSAFEAIANAMRHVTEEDWQKIYAATFPRLLESYHDGKDTKENRVFVQMDISNALFDIRDAFDAQNACLSHGDESAH